MQLALEPRVEVAFRSLAPREQKQIANAMDVIRSASGGELIQMHSIHRLGAASNQDLYEYRIDRRLRLVLSVQDDRCTIEDLVDRTRLESLAAVAAQQ